MIQLKKNSYRLNKNFNQLSGWNLCLVDENGEPIAQISINKPGIHLEDNEFILKNYSENEEIASLLIKKEILEETGKYIRVGRRNCPICKLNN